LSTDAPELSHSTSSFSQIAQHGHIVSMAG